MRVEDLGFGFRVSGFGFRVSDFRFRVLGFRVSGFGCRSLGFGVQGLGFRLEAWRIMSPMSRVANPTKSWSPVHDVNQNLRLKLEHFKVDPPYV